MSRTADDLEKENSVLRGLVAKGKGDCAYCQLPAAEIMKCKMGFPGCARMDDIMCTPQTVVDVLRDALVAIKMWFRSLEDGTEDDDPLKAIRLRVHAPVHKIIDEALDYDTLPGERTTKVISILTEQKYLWPDGNIGAVMIGDGDRSKDLCLTYAQARTLVKQITDKLGEGVS
jgi:hypothetical protein